MSWIAAVQSILTAASIVDLHLVWDPLESSLSLVVLILLWGEIQKSQRIVMSKDVTWEQYLQQSQLWLHTVFFN